MASHRHIWGIDEMARVLGVTRGGYYAWFNREPSDRSKVNDRLKCLIGSIHKISRQTYGLPRLRAELKSIGEPSNKKRVRRLMLELGIRAKQKRRYRATTNSKHSLPVAENALSRQFNPPAQDQVWAGDISYV